MWTSSQPAASLSEAQLADAWQTRSYAAERLIDSAGRRLRVVFPGRRWGGPGPDFRGALLALEDGQLVRGDVELHRRARDWVEHRHAADAAYAAVVLHVVLVPDAPTLDARGQPIPTLVLAPERGPPLPRWRARRGRAEPTRWASAWDAWDGPCAREAPAVLAVVAEAGRERFAARAARFEADLSASSPDQVVWRGLAEALGFTRNREPFAQLADAVPWATAAQVVGERGPVALSGLLLGSAGLLDQATLPEAHAWRALQRQRGIRQALGGESWDRRELRAANAPAQRCRGLAELAARWQHQPDSDGHAQRRGPAESVLDLVRAQAARRRPSLWRLAHASPWIGRGRAQVVAVNVLVPFAAAAGLPEAAEVFERLPGEPSNRVVRYMAQLLGGPGVRFRGACLQQGLLQLFRVTCAARRCEACPARGHDADLELWAASG